ncbi:hypothetical protein [Bacillus massiliglaciei]|uniref:hypothetical protein n=1 Tax=Bacillus massiliglaciei TaxID=1816693 RepID=UPI000DA62C2B|nr:hypothetical protein [Bacillus massiliglaciei]
MSSDPVKKMLAELCYFNEVDITHTFSIEGKPCMEVMCSSGHTSPYIFQLTNLRDCHTETYQDIDEAAKAIKDVLLIC